MTEIEELKEAFDDWFHHLLSEAPTCLYRDVLRDCKKALWEAYQVRKPVWTTAELEAAKTRAKELGEALGIEGQ